MMPLCAPIADVMMSRGIEDPEQFLAPSKWSDMPSPLQIQGMRAAVDRILLAVRLKQRVAVFGDYDCDGALSAAILQVTLGRLGVRPVIYLPHRDEGYGFTNEAVHRFSLSGTDLVITIDNGINAAGPIQLARRLGIDVVVVDHHHIETSAETICVWSQEYCAAGLGLMLCWALLEAAQVSEAEIATVLKSLSRLAAIASIADCVPLTGPTRILTRIGLTELGNTHHAGLQKLLRWAGVRPGHSPSSEQIAFRVAPRINAAGRVGHPNEVIRMLSANTIEGQIESAFALDRLNQERRALEKEALEELLLMVGNRAPASLVIYGPQWKKGIAGILASRARERYGVPAVVLVHDSHTGMAVGSARSVEGFSLIEALRACRSQLHRFGGHDQAAGLTVAVECIDSFRREFDTFVLENPPKRIEAREAEADLDLGMANHRFFEQLRQLEPFGIGNPTPIFRVKDADVSPATPGFVFVSQGNTRLPGRKSKGNIKARSAVSVSGRGTVLLALNGTTASLVRLVENSADLRTI